MELTRRDAAAALAAVGAGGVAVVANSGESGEESAGIDREIRETMIAAAEVVYPDAVTGIEEFVTAFLASRLDEDSHAAGIADAVDAIEGEAEAWHDSQFADLDPDTRDSLLRSMTVDTAEERRDGTTAEQVRYYVVNELLLALYASPTGGELVGIENPQGHAGGIDSYQRGPTP